MIYVLGGLLMLLFFALSAIHFYWAVGGKWGFQEVLPTNTEGVKVLNPKTIDSIIVGSVLLFFAFFYSVKISILPIELPHWLLYYGGWAIPAIFLLRSIGDFKYIGLFKSVKSTPFAAKDNSYFIPLCISLALIGFFVQSYY